MNTTWRAPLALSFAVIVLSWLTFRYIYSPQENDFLAATEAHYLKVASERNFQNKISYSDCIVQDGGLSTEKMESRGLVFASSMITGQLISISPR